LRSLPGAAYSLCGIILQGFVHPALGNHLPETTGRRNPPGKTIEGPVATAGILSAAIALISFVTGMAILKKAYKNLPQGSGRRARPV